MILFCVGRGGSRTAATSKMERFVIIVNGWKPLTIITKRSILDVAAALDPPLCGEPLNEVMHKYGRWKNAVEGKGLRVNVDKTKGIQLLFGKKAVFQRWILVVSVVNRLVIILFSVRNVRGGFIVVVLMCLRR